MFKSLVKKFPLSKKIELAYITLGINSPEKEAIDGVISKFSLHPITSTILGRSFGSLAQAIEFSVDVMNNNEDVMQSFDSELAGKILRNPVARKKATEGIMMFINNHHDKDLLTSALTKLADLPVDGFGDVNYESLDSFIEKGIFPFLDRALPQKELIGYDTIVDCPYCNEKYMHHIGV